MISLKHPATGHEISVDKESADFWKAAGYRESTAKAPAKRAAAKRSTSRSTKSDSK